MERRSFVKNTSVAATALALIPVVSSCNTNSLNTIGVQLFSLPKLLEENFNSGIKKIAEIGYKEIEMYGPFPFCLQTVKKRWESITPAFGFSGSGYFGHTLREIKTISEEHTVKVTSIHLDMETMQTRMDEIGREGDLVFFEMDIYWDGCRRC